MKSTSLKAILVMVAEVQADFTLTGTQHLDVTTYHHEGWLNDFSSANIRSGGSVDALLLSGSSTADVSGGYVDMFQAGHTSTASVSSGSVDLLWAYNTSTVNISGGSVQELAAENLSFGSQAVNITGGTIERLCPLIRLQENEYFSYSGLLSDLTPVGLHVASGTVGRISTDIVACGNSTASVYGGNVTSLAACNASIATITDGSVTSLFAQDISTVNISGGRVLSLLADDTSTVKLYGYDFQLGSGLSWGAGCQIILGTGLLYGKWFGSTDTWTIEIYEHNPTATIMAIPEPTTLLLLGLGGLFLRRRS